MAKTKNDIYGQIAYGGVSTSAANTLTYELINMGISLFDKVGMEISLIEYFPNLAAYQSLQDVSDLMYFGLSTSNTAAAIAANDPSIIDIVQLQPHLVGTPANFELRFVPQDNSTDLTKRPGGAVLVPPRPLYIYVGTTGFAATTSVNARIHFRFKSLTPADYIELVESSRIVA